VSMERKIAMALPPNPRALLIVAAAAVLGGCAAASTNTGAFKVSGCSAPGGQCARAKYGYACWTRSTPDDINSITAQIKASPTMIMTEYAAGQYFPSVTCYFTVKDSKGRKAVYEAYAPAI
jgi:hypothetical protein